MTLAAVAGAAWLSANLASYWRYRSALADPEASQWALLEQYLRANATTAFGRAHEFSSIRSIDAYRARVPVSSYAGIEPAIDDIARGGDNVLTRDSVRTLALSSGSVSAAKRIPFTRTLQKEFRRAVAPWLVDLYRRHPSLVSGCSYWSITPVAQEHAAVPGRPPVGFEEDSAYLGAAWKHLVDATLAVPGAVRWVHDIESFRYVTLLFLLHRRDLSLISVWHPSFLTLLLDALAPHWPSLIDDVRDGTIRPPKPFDAQLQQRLLGSLRPRPHRAAELATLAPDRITSIWPRLGLISCWGDAHARAHLPAVQRMIPGVAIQPKGLLATEAVVTIPFAGRMPLAIRSHFFEFFRDGRSYLAHQLQTGEQYSVVVTTGGGLYRYRLDDLVEVNGFVGKTPALTFLGKADHVSDLCGEKLNESFVARALEQACRLAGVEPRWALLAPDRMTGTAGYTLYVESTDAPPIALAEFLEAGLSHNPHYQYCRSLGQLAPIRVFHSSGSMWPRYLAKCVERGQRLGDVKPLALSTSDGWSSVFEGRYCDAETLLVR
jgi:GH3 auxin-responsive promoter